MKKNKIELLKLQEESQKLFQQELHEELNRNNNKKLQETHSYLPTEKELANEVASQLHEDWRKTRLLENGTYDPRWKTIKDENFIAKLDENNLPNNIRINNDGIFEIDIANSSYKELSSDWQKENFEAAQVVAKLALNPKYIPKKEAGNIIHNEWLKRNDWAKGGELDVPFEELPENEQAKDLDQLNIAIKTKADMELRNRTIDKTPEEYLKQVKDLSMKDIRKLNSTIDTLEKKTPSNKYKEEFGRHL